jgi:uncharacterized protein
MTNFVPIFPLGIVVYPGENLNLHIFEPRYKQLIKECIASGKPFGMPAVINNKVTEIGTLMEITELVKEYDDGKMDIRTKGLSVFRILEVIKTVPDKLYSGAIVNHPANNMTGSSELMQKIITSIRELHRLQEVSKDFAKPDEALNCYDVAHYAGLMLEEEYELLQLMHELQRQEYLKRHLAKVLPLMAGMEEMKARVKLNGHFKNLSALDFDI